MGFGPRYLAPPKGVVPDFFQYGTSLRQESNRASILKDMVEEVLREQDFLSKTDSVVWTKSEPWAKGVAGKIPLGRAVFASLARQFEVTPDGSRTAWHLVTEEGSSPDYNVIVYEVQLILSP